MWWDRLRWKLPLLLQGGLTVPFTAMLHIKHAHYVPVWEGSGR